MKRKKLVRRFGRLNLHTAGLCIIIPLMLIFSVVVTPYSNGISSFSGTVNSTKLTVLRIIWLLITAALLYCLYITKADKHWLFVIYTVLSLFGIVATFWLFLLS